MSSIIVPNGLNSLCFSLLTGNCWKLRCRNCPVPGTIPGCTVMLMDSTVIIDFERDFVTDGTHSRG